MNNNNQSENYILKVVLLGNTSVGKTTLRLKYIGQSFRYNYLPTLGADFSLQSVTYGNKTIEFQIWDIGGQTTYNLVRKNFYAGSNGSLVLYDITNQQSFDNVDFWVDEFLNYCGENQVPIVLIGNKIDLRSEEKKDIITYDQGKKLAEKITKDKHITVSFLETSALNGINLTKAFDIIKENYFH
ncbi:MAG: Rab family GTPase [Candidatus Thorarchaeota archaeon]